MVTCVLVDWIGNFLGLNRVERLPYAGWILEISGLLVVAFDLSKRLELFAETSLVDRVKQWLLEFPLLNQNRIIGAMSAHLSLGVPRVSARLKVRPGSDASTDELVEFLMRQYERLDDQVSDIREEFKDDLSALRKEVEHSDNTIRDEIAAVQSQSTKAHLGDVGLEVVGLGWILIGLTLATVPEFVLSMFGWLVNLLEL